MLFFASRFCEFMFFARDSAILCKISHISQNLGADSALNLNIFR
ncbi:hypothetical protein ACWIUD_06155 [Helicobacter sp. 23-1044]